MIDPGVTTLIQTTFIQHIQAAYSVVTQYALNLLYIFTVIELVLFGLLWALQQGSAWEQLFFKVLKIGLIFFVVQNYSFLLNSIIQSFAQIGGVIVNAQHVGQYIFDPAKIWQYGYDIGLNLLKIAATTSGVGLSFIYIFLGMGILLVFGLFGIQILLQIVGFYLVALIALIVMPLGTFSPTMTMFNRSVEAVLKAGVRVMVLIVVVGIAITTWQGFHLANLQPPYHISVLLGLFFSSLVFLYCAIYLPKLVADVIGQFGEHNTVSHTAISNSVITPSATSSTADLQMMSMTAATHIDTQSSQMSAAGLTNSTQPTMMQGGQIASANLVQSTSGQSGFLSFQKSEGDLNNTLHHADIIAKSISDQTVKKIESTLRNILKTRDNKNVSGE